MTRRATDSTTISRNSSSSVIFIFLAVSAALAALRAIDRGYDRHRQKTRTYTHDSCNSRARSHCARSRSRSHVNRRRSDYDSCRHDKRSRRTSVFPSSYSEVNLDEYGQEPQRCITDGVDVSRPRRPSLTWEEDDRTLVNDRNEDLDRRVILYRNDRAHVQSSGRHEYVHRKRYEKYGN